MTDNEFLSDLFLGDKAAVALAKMLVALSHTWDDLHDQDKAVSQESVTAAFEAMLFDIPANEFYQRFSNHLVPVMRSAVLAWRGANTLEVKPSLQAREIAHVARYELANVIVMMAACMRGMDYAAQHAAEILLRSQKNTLADYLKELESRYGPVSP